MKHVFSGIHLTSKHKYDFYLYVFPLVSTSNSVWSSSGVFTDTVNDLGEVKCRTTHLTSFAVLVDPAVGHLCMCFHV